MGKMDEVQGLFEQASVHVETARDLLTLLTAVVKKVEEIVPAADVAGLLSTTGSWLGTALAPIDRAFGKMQDRWLERQVNFIRAVSQGDKPISEEAAVKLIAIRAGQLKDWGAKFENGVEKAKEDKK
jgi:hypothetical protein